MLCVIQEGIQQLILLAKIKLTPCFRNTQISSQSKFNMNCKMFWYLGIYSKDCGKMQEFGLL